MERAPRQRLDVLLVERGLAESREKAKALVLAGEVMVHGQVVSAPSRQVAAHAEVQVGKALPYVSRGGLKLQHALDTFEIDVRGLVCADIGASTGGFTDCLLQRGAARIYAVDVGTGQLAWSLRHDPRVVVLEGVNVRYLRELPEPVDLATIDVSFISLRLVLPAAVRLLKPSAQIVALVKPQFEAGPRSVGKGGVVRDTDVHRRVLRQVVQWASRLALHPCGVDSSPIRGQAGNVEFLLYLSRGAPCPLPIDDQSAIERAVSTAPTPQSKGLGGTGPIALARAHSGAVVAGPGETWER